MRWWAAASSPARCAISWVSWPSRLPERHRHQTQILKSNRNDRPKPSARCFRLANLAGGRGQWARKQAPPTVSILPLPSGRPPRRSHHPAQRAPGPGRTKLPALSRSQQVRWHCHCCFERLVYNRAGSESTHLCWGPERGFASQEGRLPACRGPGAKRE